jgi:hypothetical protein
MDPHTNQPSQPGVPGAMRQPVPQPQQPLGVTPPAPGTVALPTPPTPQQPAVPATLGAIPVAAPAGSQPNMPATPPPSWPEVPDPRVTNTPMAAGIPQAPTPAPTGKRKAALIIVAIAVAVVLAVAAGLWLFVLKGSGHRSADSEAQRSSQHATATGMATLNRVTLVPPATIAGFTLRNSGISTISDYISDDRTCELIVGVVTGSQLPGASLDAIIEPQLQQLRDAGATIVGPNAGAAVTVKQTASTKSYSMPTLNFEFSEGPKHAVVHYSAVILKSGDRAVLNRTCINATGTVDASHIRAVDEIAKQVTVTVN